MSLSLSLLGTSLLSLLLAGYLTRKYGLPPPAPKIAAIDLGTTFSSVGIYQAVTGVTDIIADETGRQCIPSVVAFLPNGTVIVGSKAVEQQEHNPLRTIYDAKRFIGRKLSEDDPQFQVDRKRYPFKIELSADGLALFVIPLENNIVKKITPEEVGGIIINYLRKAAEKKYETKIIWAVISVPAEFDEEQRNATSLAVQKAGMESRRVISEPTAAALAYGLHKKKDVEYIAVVDLGGGTLDVSILWLQGGIFVTVAMAGNNRLGGQDFNDRVQNHLLQYIEENYGKALNDKEDIQQLRLAVETAKIQLTTLPVTNIDLNLRSLGKIHYRLTRDDFEFLNEDLFESITEPIKAALNDAEIKASDIDEIVLVGGSTRIPRVRSVVGRYFGKAPNHGVDPELAVVTGVSVQAGVIGGGWPLQVSAIELPVKRRKQHIFTRQKKSDHATEHFQG
uniref:Heat shock 70 kDa protein 13 n=1 Tax=Elaeophora elaphi TaxID=1147741 RepID=A0A0R3RH60_9BILA